MGRAQSLGRTTAALLLAVVAALVSVASVAAAAPASASPQRTTSVAAPHATTSTTTSPVRTGDRHAGPTRTHLVAPSAGTGPGGAHHLTEHVPALAALPPHVAAPAPPAGPVVLVPSPAGVAPAGLHAVSAAPRAPPVDVLLPLAQHASTST